MNLTHQDKIKIRKLAEILYDSFVWSDSDEGHVYWNEVYNKLVGYARKEENN